MNIFTLIWQFISSLIPKAEVGLPVKPPETPDDLKRAVSDIINFMNSGPVYTDGAVINAEKGTIIHKVSQTDADTLAVALIEAAEDKRNPMPLPYGMACLCAESLFDPNCLNGNYLGSNLTKAPDGFDVGIAQLKLKYLIGNEGITTVEQAQAFALDPSKAIAYCFRTMSARIKLADAFIAGSHGLGENANFKNPYYVATAMYNFGQAGFNALDKTKPVSHSDTVKRYEQSFAKTLQYLSIFDDYSP